MDVSFRDWADLPAHILDILVTKLDRFYDYIRFRVVCTKWRCVAIEANVDHMINFDVVNASRKKLPMLMFKTDENSDEWRSLYNVSSNETYTVELPIPYKYRFLGSSRGWLFCLQENMVVTLVNPFNNSCISLPVFEDPRKFFRQYWRNYFEYHIKKGILLSDPSVTPESFGVVVLYTMGKLAFFKSGGQCWNLIKSRLHLSDIIYYKDKLYGVSNFEQLAQIDLDGTVKTLIQGTAKCSVDSVYIVESQDGELLMVKRVWRLRDPLVNNLYYKTNHSDFDEFDDAEYNDTDDFPYSDNEIVSSDREGEILETHYDGSLRTFEFKVFKMTRPIEEESPTWVEMNNIGKQALFVGDNHSVSVSTTDFPGCMPNSIYYTTEIHNLMFPYTYCGLKEDSGIFNLEDGRFYHHHVLGSSYKYTHPPIWFVPNPQEIN